MVSALLSTEVPYWGQSLLRVLGGIVAVLIPAGTIVYVFLFKMMSFMQSRLGPMEAGPYGSMQLMAEVGKWLQKEDIFTERSARIVFVVGNLPSPLIGGVRTPISAYLSFSTSIVANNRRKWRPVILSPSLRSRVNSAKNRVGSV